MNRTLTAAGAAVLLATLAACGSSSSGSSDSGNKASNAGAAPAASKPLDAGTAFTKLAAKVSTAKLSETVTAATDGNHLLGRPGQYTSKIDFEDTRIKASDVQGVEKGDVTRGGSIEAFANAADAQTRAKYVEAVTKSMPALNEYDYVHGTVLVRVSHLLTPDQAAAYKTAADSLG